MEAPVLSLEALARAIPDGALLAIPPDYSGVAMAATRALIRRGAKDLRLLAVPTSGMQADLLIGAGCVASLEAAAVSLGEAGPAPRFTEAVKSGALAIKDSTCPAIHAALQAAEKGQPFAPLRGLIGTDVLAHRADWKLVPNPFAADDPVVLLPAIVPEVALFHAPKADRAGNVWIGRRRELMVMAHAATRCLVTVEEVVDGDLLAEDAMAAGTIPALYVEGIAEARRGAWPIACPGHYEADGEHIQSYGRAARTAEGFQRYLAEHVLAERRAA
ncbi:MAG: CoA synthetase [Alphaproteobacteria bacterium]|nr:CoA synthetase [Alphaproteobacteria bacterium]